MDSKPSQHLQSYLLRHTILYEIIRPQTDTVLFISNAIKEIEYENDIKII